MCAVTGTEDLRRAVDEHGWVVVSSPAGGGRPTVSSTVGLTDQSLPELVVLGLPEQVGGALLHELVERELAGFGSPDGVPVPDLLEGGTDPVLIPVVGQVSGVPACEVYGDAVRLRQLAWPDDAGLLPWEPGFAHPDLQPVMGEPPHEGAADLGDWPLPDDPHLQVLSSPAVAEGGADVLLVVCTDDGELRFLDGGSDFDPDAAVVECLHDALARDLTLVDAVRPLLQGQVAERDQVGAAWRIGDW
jgi:hypothetical protein